MKPDNKKYRIRRLTPKEIGTLMGFKPEDDDKMKAMNISDTQRNKCYGNGLITNCVKLLFEHLYKSQYNPGYVCSDTRMEVTN